MLSYGYFLRLLSRHHLMPAPSDAVRQNAAHDLIEILTEFLCVQLFLKIG
jgi:hypothetical protein